MTMLRLEVLMLMMVVSPVLLYAQTSPTTLAAATTTTPPPTEECPSSGGPGEVEDSSIQDESTNGTGCDATDFTFSVKGKTVAENDGRVGVIVITRSKAGVKAGLKLSVTVRTANAKRAIDPFDMNVVFKECSTEVTILVRLRDDCDYETKTEKYKVVISRPSDGTIKDGVSFITVLDNDIKQN